VIPDELLFIIVSSNSCEVPEEKLLKICILFVSYFISSWLFFGDQNIVNHIYLCSRFSRRIVQQLQEYGNKDRSDRHMDRSDVMQFKSSSTKTRVPRSLAVRSPSEWTDGPSGRAATPVLNPECPVRSPFASRSQPVRTPSNALHQKTGVSDVALGPSGRPIIPSGQPVLNLIFHVYFK
jgi:hypothetical protein